MNRKIISIALAVVVSLTCITGCAKSNKIENKSIKISAYKGIEVPEVTLTEVDDKAVEDQISAVLDENKTSEKITDRAVENGDIITLDYEGKINGEAFDGGSATDASLGIGSGQFIEGFEDSAIGHNIGDTYDWNGKFPEQYQSEELAGKDVVFTITIKGITKETLPELDDKLVKKISETSKTVAEYKKEVKKSLKKQAREAQKNELMASVMKAVLDNTEVKQYNKDELDKKCKETIDQYKQMAKEYDMSYEDLATQSGAKSTEDMEKQIEDSVKGQMKQSMVAEAIIEKEKLATSDKEYDKYYKKLADANGFDSVKAMEEQVDKEQIKDAANYLIVAEWLADNCIQTKENAKGK